MSDPRLTAASMLQRILEQKIFLSEAKNALEGHTETDTAFVNMLVLTSLRRLVYLRRVLKQFVRKKLPAQAAFAEYALILGTTEILCLQTPDYAVINSYVNLVKSQSDKYVAGFVNAVLRKICAEKERLLAEDDGAFFTSAFFGILKNSYGRKTVRKLEQASRQEPPLDLTVKQNPAAWAEKLGGTCLPGGTVRLKSPGRINKLPGFAEGEWWVQDFAASLPVKMLGPLTGQRVLDLCAAPGGKTAQLINAGADVTALDISDSRLQTLHENLQRLRLPATQTVCADAAEFLADFKNAPFDIILLDAPCSATGTLRRHPELVHIKNSSDIAERLPLQQELLSLAPSALKPGGKLLYCVCSLAREEGENQIEEFLQKHKDFSVVPLAPKLPEGLAELAIPGGFIRTLPQHLNNLGGADGFFIALLQKAGA